MSSFEITAPLVYADLSFRTEVSLLDLAELLSERHFGGLRFGGLDLHIYDEVPAVFLLILGWRFILHEGKGVYCLNCFSESNSLLKPEGERIDISLPLFVTFKEKCGNDYVVELGPAAGFRGIAESR